MAKATIASVFAPKANTQTQTATNQLDIENPQIRDAIIQQLGIEPPKPKANLLEKAIGLLDMFRATDDIRKAQKEGNIGAGIIDYFADIPKAIGTAITGDDYRDATDKEGGAEIAKSMGMVPLAQGVAGFILDVGLDPTTYISIGVGTGAKILTKAGVKALTKPGAKLSARLTSEFMEQFSKRGANEVAELAAKEGIKIAEKTTAREIAEQFAIKRLGDYSQQGVKVFKDVGLDESDKLMQQIMKEGVFDQGGFKFAGKRIFDLNPTTEKVLSPYFDPLKTGYKGIKKIPIIGGAVEKGVQGLQNFFQKGAGTLGQLFSKKQEFTAGNTARFGNLYDATTRLNDYLSGATNEVRREYSDVYKFLNTVDNADDLKALPYIIENTPVEKLKKLPRDVQDSISKLMIATRKAKEIIPPKPSILQLQEMGDFKNIIDRKGVKRKVFNKLFSDNQVKTLQEEGIESVEDMLAFLKNKQNQYPTEIPYQQTKEKVVELSRARAGKDPKVRKIIEQIDYVNNNPKVKQLLDTYNEFVATADDIGKGLDESLKIISKDMPELAQKYKVAMEQFPKYEKKIVELQAQYKEALEKAYQDNKIKTVETFTAYKSGLTPYQQLAQKLKKSPGEMKTLENQLFSKAKKAEKAYKEAVKQYDTKINDVKKFLDPKLQDWFDKHIATKMDQSEFLYERGYIKGKSKATYFGREVTKTPSGKILDGKGGTASSPFSPNVAQMLDPRKALNQKKRIYDYLADLVGAGGETKITQAKGKEATAQIVEQMAKDEMKYQTAVSFEGLAKQVVNGEITDTAGNKIYQTIDDIVQFDPAFGKEYQEHIVTFHDTGKMPEPLKSKLEVMGYKQLGIPAFDEAGAWFDEESYSVINKIHKSFFGEEAINEFVKLYDKVQNMIKRSQTVWFPAFHVRNAASNVFVNLTAGVTNPVRYADATVIQRYINALGGKNEKLIAELGAKKIQGMTITDIYNIANRAGVLGSNFYSELSEELLQKPSGALSKLNPFSNQFFMQKAGGFVEDNARIALFLDRLAKGDDTISAAMKVKEILFDYNDLSSFEKNIMRRFVPYWTWVSKNAINMTKMIVLQPGKYSTIMKGYKNIQKAFGNMSEEDQEKLPDWVKKGLNIGMMDGENATVISQFGLPTEAFEQLFETNPLNQLGTIPKSIIEIATGQNIFKGKAIVDDTSGKQFRNFPQYIKDRMGYREEVRKNKDGKEYTVYYVDAWAKYWLNNLLGRTASTYSKVSTMGEMSGLESDLLNIFTGVKKYDFNMQEEEEKRNIEQTKSLYDSLLKMGMARKYTNYSIPKESKQNILSMIGNN